MKKCRKNYQKDRWGTQSPASYRAPRALPWPPALLLLQARLPRESSGGRRPVAAAPQGSSAARREGFGWSSVPSSGAPARPERCSGRPGWRSCWTVHSRSPGAGCRQRRRVQLGSSAPRPPQAAGPGRLRLRHCAAMQAPSRCTHHPCMQRALCECLECMVAFACVACNL